MSQKCQLAKVVISQVPFFHQILASQIHQNNPEPRPLPGKPTVVEDKKKNDERDVFRPS